MVCTPIEVGSSSSVGTFSTLILKAIVHVAPGASETWAPPCGVKRSRPVAGSTTVTSKTTPAQAEPAAPTGADVTAKTPGSAPVHDRIAGSTVPQDGTSVMPWSPAHSPGSPALQIVLVPPDCGGVDWLKISIDASRFVSPTVAPIGNVGVVELPWPAWAAAGASARHPITTTDVISHRARIAARAVPP